MTGKEQDAKAAEFVSIRKATSQLDMLLVNEQTIALAAELRRQIEENLADKSISNVVRKALEQMHGKLERFDDPTNKVA